MERLLVVSPDISWQCLQYKRNLLDLTVHSLRESTFMLMKPIRLSQMTSESAPRHLPGNRTDSPQLTTTDASDHPSTDDVSLVEALMKDDNTDHLTARRQAKQLANTLQQIDAKLRALQMSELPAAPSKAELDQLLSECHR